MIPEAAYSYDCFCNLVKIAQVFQVHEDINGSIGIPIDNRISDDRVNFFAPRTERGYLLRVLRLKNFANPKKGKHRMPYYIWTPWGEFSQEARDDLDWQKLVPPILRELNVSSVHAFSCAFTGHDGWAHAITQVAGKELPWPELIKYWNLELFRGYKQSELYHKQTAEDANMYEFLEDLRREKNQEHTLIRELWNKHCTHWLKENGF
ncbi:hypothetical protein GF391_01760 [Candidatus Uhrbacteria bacterium]|nr:hypothetical protein [Candidatus Uhrbacteria bacterium]